MLSGYTKVTRLGLYSIGAASLCSVWACGDLAVADRERLSVVVKVKVVLDELSFAPEEWCADRLMDLTIRSGYVGKLTVKALNRWPIVNRDLDASPGLGPFLEADRADIREAQFTITTSTNLPEFWIAGLFVPVINHKPTSEDPDSWVSTSGDQFIPKGLCESSAGTCEPRRDGEGVPFVRPEPGVTRYQVTLRLNDADPALADTTCL